MIRSSQRMPIPTLACSTAWTLEVSRTAAAALFVLVRCTQAVVDEPNDRAAPSREATTATAFDNNVGGETKTSKPSQELDG